MIVKIPKLWDFAPDPHTGDGLRRPSATLPRPSPKPLPLQLHNSWPVTVTRSRTAEHRCCSAFAALSALTAQQEQRGVDTSKSALDS